MTNLTPNHPAVEAATFAQWNSQRESHWCPYDDVSDVVKDRWRRGTTNALNAALSHLTADDLPARLVRDIQARTIRATARAATYEEGGVPGDHDWDRATVAAWLNELADNIERDGNA